MGRLENKVCVVTGSAKGIGLSIADALLREGAKVVYADVDPSVVDVAAAACRANQLSGSTAIGVKVDASDREEVSALCGSHRVRVGRLGRLFQQCRN